MIDKNLIASSGLEISASPEKVWTVLTDPQYIKTYLFGTETTTDWRVGSKILFQGEHNGQSYEDKGNVLINIENEKLKYSYWNGFSGLEDLPENYALLNYFIEDLGDGKVWFKWEQQGFASRDGQCHTEQMLGPMLKQIKDLAESL